MIGQALRDRLIAVYETWLEQDDLGRRYVGVCDPQSDHGATSVRQLLEELVRSSSGQKAMFERPAALDHPDSTLLQLFSSPLVLRTGPRGLVEAVALQALCLQVIPRLLFEAHQHPGPIDHDLQPGAGLLAQRQSDEARAAMPCIDDPADRAELADSLMKVLKAQLGHRPIRSFFTVEVAANGYRLWQPHLRAAKDAGTSLARRIVPTSAGSVSVDVLRYPHQEQCTVRAYEWCAELREQASSEWPDEVAYGMAYRFDREEGLPVGGKSDLMIAADGLADVDLLQVSAFLEQHDDAEALMEEGDLAFVWLWERRSDARAGAGQACLLAALGDLCRRLRDIRTVVVDLKPYQYVVTDGAAMPATVHIEKLEALDRLQTFVESLRLGEVVKGHCRYIVNREGDDPDAAMRVLGLAGQAQRR